MSDSDDRHPSQTISRAGADSPEKRGDVEIYERYKSDAEFRVSLARTLVGISDGGGKAYQFVVDGVRYIVRHNCDGSYTWIF